MECDDLDLPVIMDSVSLEKLCVSQGFKLNSESKDELSFMALSKIGPSLAQKLLCRLVELEKLEWQDKNFEVEEIQDFWEDEEGCDWYLIKWRGWGTMFNSWQKKSTLLNCDDLLENFEKNHSGCSETSMPTQKSVGKMERLREIWCRLERGKLTPSLLCDFPDPDPKMKALQLKALEMIRTPSCRYKRRSQTKGRSMKMSLADARRALREWEQDINELDPPLSVENKVDLEGPPTQFTYIVDYKAGKGVFISDDPLIGCDCSPCHKNKKQCCPSESGCNYVYNVHKRVTFPPGTPIYECNKRCACGSECSNRVVQLGRKFKVCIFRTKNRGWGVRAEQKIKRGSFVMEYVGEVITNEEAERRGRVYDAEGRTYLFDLDFSGEDSVFTVDAGRCGNVSHFVNHSCDPNLAVYVVWVNNLDRRLPRIAFFAKVDIEKGEELTFDYKMTGETHSGDAEPRAECSTPRLSLAQDPGVSTSLGSSSLPIVASPAKSLLPNEVFTPPRPLTPRDPPPTGAPPSPSCSTSTFSSEGESNKVRIRCQCGAKKCRGYLF